ncbi:MAG: methyltransferase domain-containing protein [Pseudobdellovibrionaceae bacterium]
MADTRQLLVENYFRSALQALQSYQWGEAADFLAQALSFDEKNPLLWHYLGVAWNAQGERNQACDALKMALTLDPENIETLKILGGILYDLGDYEQSSLYFLKANKAAQFADPSIKYLLAHAFFSAADFARALSLMQDLVIQFPENSQYVIAFAAFSKKFLPEFNAKTLEALEICLKHQDVWFRGLTNSWTVFFLSNPRYAPLIQFSSRYDPDIPLETISPCLEDPFLCLGLEKIILSSNALELTFSNLRRYFLVHWRNAAQWPAEILPFLASLAAQCWYNEYVYYRDDDELHELAALKEHLSNLLDTTSGELPQEAACLTALYACYEPLGTLYTKNAPLPFAKDVLQKMLAFTICQLDEPRREMAIYKTIPHFTEIDDQTSKAVQAMYEGRPYPRWRNIGAQALQQKTIDASAGLQVLIAGCGTGQEAINNALRLRKANITAIDLSRNSIAYAKRKAEELGLDSLIDFQHGDLMKIADLGQTFDFITCSGVLHHLKDPEKGLKALLSVLKPDGRLSLSLYSKAARDYMLNPALDYIRTHGYGTSDDDLRKFRREVILLKDNKPVQRCMKANDFFSLSECNDLLFHVQEHRYTAPMIWDMAHRHGLTPMRVQMPPDKLRDFNTLFPGESPLDPQRLERFEEEFPQAFLEMYHIYFKRTGAPDGQPIDYL